MCICCRYINQELFSVFSAETLVSNCTEKVLDLLNWKIVVSILIFWQFSNAFDFDILMASLLGNTILAGTRTRARYQHYFNPFVSAFTVFDYIFEARVYFFQILLARHQHTRSYSLLDMMNLLHIFLYIARPI